MTKQLYLCQSLVLCKNLNFGFKLHVKRIINLQDELLHIHKRIISKFTAPVPLQIRFSWGGYVGWLRRDADDNLSPKQHPQQKL